MSSTIESFAAQCHDLLKAEPGPAGRQKVCALLERTLTDRSFVERYLNDETPDRKVLFEDPELGFCVVAHHYRGAKVSPPHDHGPTWAIYGQAVGETDMSDFDCVERSAADKHGKARRTRTYKLTPGKAHLYNEGDLHSPSRENSTRLIRIEGANMDRVKRYPYKEV